MQSHKMTGCIGGFRTQTVAARGDAISGSDRSLHTGANGAACLCMYILKTVSDTYTMLQMAFYILVQLEDFCEFAEFDDLKLKVR